MSLRDAWDSQAPNWIAWTRQNHDDSFFAFHGLRFFEIVPVPGRLTLEPATGRIALGREKGEVSRADVALVVAAALADDSTIGRTIDFNNGSDGNGVPIAEALAG